MKQIYNIEELKTHINNYNQKYPNQRITYKRLEEETGIKSLLFSSIKEITDYVKKINKLIRNCSVENNNIVKTYSIMELKNIIDNISNKYVTEKITLLQLEKETEIKYKFFVSNSEVKNYIKYKNKLKSFSFIMKIIKENVNDINESYPNTLLTPDIISNFLGIPSILFKDRDIFKRFLFANNEDILKKIDKKSKTKFKSLCRYCHFMDKYDLLNEWDYEKNNELGLTPYNVSYGSAKNVWWKCKEGHSFKCNINLKIIHNKNCHLCK